MVETPLTPRQAVFVKKLSEGNTQTNAAVLAGYSRNTAAVMGSKLVHNAKIIKALERSGLTDLKIADTLNSVVDAGMGNRNKATPDTSLKALELALRLKGNLDTFKEDHTTNNTTNIAIQLSNMDSSELTTTLEELSNSIKQLQR